MNIILDKIVEFAYYLNSSKKYKSFKYKVNRILNDETYPKKKFFDIFMILLVLFTLYILIDEKEKLHPIFYTFENIAITIFAIEWLLRLWVSSDIHKIIIDNYEKYQLLGRKYRIKKIGKEIIKEKFKFIKSPMSIIDLLSILPSFRAFRVLKLFLIFRLFKIFRYTNSINEFLYVFIEKRFEFGTLLLLYGFVVFFSSTAIYMYEGIGGVNPKIESYFDAVYWSIITISTVGYGDVTPVTDEGKVITLILILGGFTTVVLATSIATNALTEKLEIVRENDVKSKASKFKKYILICGFGYIGYVLAKELKQSGEEFIIIDEKDEEVKYAMEHNYKAIQGDATNYELLTSLKIESRVKSIAILTNNDAVNLSILLTVKSINPNIETFVVANNKSSKSKFYMAGASKIIFPYELAALMGIEYIGQPMGFDVIDNILFAKDGVMLDEIEVKKSLDLKKLKDTKYKEYKLKVIAIIRNKNINDFIFNPKDDLIIFKGDLIIVFGNGDLINSFKLKWFN